LRSGSGRQNASRTWEVLISTKGQERPPDWNHGLRRQTLVEYLLNDIMHGRLRPGQRLVVQELAERLGVGRTPIREALITLAGIGVVEIRPNRGAVIRSVGAREVRHFYLVRRALECEAIRTACGRIGDAELRELAAEFRRLIGVDTDDRDRSISDARAHALDNRLHDLIAEHCGNALLLDELNRLKLLSRAFRDYAYEHGGPLGTSLLKDIEAREHLAIVEALIARDRRAAVRAMSRHIVSGIRDLREISFVHAGIAPESRHRSRHPATDGHASADGRSRGPG
jgi:DNA-binding GntR family transcriptional regulator